MPFGVPGIHLSNVCGFLSWFCAASQSYEVDQVHDGVYVGSSLKQTPLPFKFSK